MNFQDMFSTPKTEQLTSEEVEERLSNLSYGDIDKLSPQETRALVDGIRNSYNFADRITTMLAVSIIEVSKLLGPASTREMVNELIDMLEAHERGQCTCGEDH